MKLISTTTYADNAEDISEEVDDVQVEVEGRKDVLLRAEGVLVLPSHHDLGVVDQVEGEDDAPYGRVDDVQGPTRRGKLSS